MSKINKLSVAFVELPLSAKGPFHQNVHDSMTGNAAFTAPSVTMPTYESQIDAFEAKLNALLAARTAVVQAEWELTQAEAVLDATGRALVGYVESVSANNPATLESSGFLLASPRKPVGILPAPTNLRAESLQTGAVQIRWSRDRGSLTFEGECATNPNGPWTRFYSGSRARCDATDLVPGTAYWFRVRVLGSAGWSDWSDAIMKRPL